MQVGAGNSPPTRSGSLLLNRPFSTNGKPETLGGDIHITQDGSVTPVDYYLKALPGECLLVARVIGHIVAASGNLTPGGYGDLPVLTNGIQLFLTKKTEAGLLTFDISNGLLLKTHEDWGRWCFDAKPVGPYGAAAKTPYFQFRWTFTKYGQPWGLVLLEGESVGVRINDDLEGLAEQSIISEGTHLGVPSPFWALLL